MTAAVQPHREPLRATLIRNLIIAVAAATVIAISSARSAYPVRWPVAAIVMLWPTFGGHYIEVWYLNWLRPRLPAAPSMQRLARLATWFVGGCGLAAAMTLTARALGANQPARWPAWWLLGVVFIGVELIVHAALLMRRQPNFFDGRG